MALGSVSHFNIDALVQKQVFYDFFFHFEPEHVAVCPEPGNGFALEPFAGIQAEPALAVQGVIGLVVVEVTLIEPFNKLNRE